MKRSLWKIVLTFILVVIFALAALIVVEAGGPFDPSEGWLYRSQRGLEEMVVRLQSSSPAGQASQRVELAYRRLRDVERLAGSAYESAAILELEQAVHDAVQSASLCQPSDAYQLRSTLLALFEQVERAYPQETSALNDFRRWIGAVTQRLRQPGLQLSELANVSVDPVTNEASQVLGDQPAPTKAAPQPIQIDPRVVYFQPGSSGAKHTFYPLIGKHAKLQCTSCHPSGEFAGTGKVCESCHRTQKPASHFPGRCQLCHAPTAWTDIHFQHTVPLANDCKSCHLGSQPANHYPGQCSACHSTTAWIPASFDHAVAGATDCLSCHAGSRPTDHWNGQCSACHSTSGWLPASFNHEAAGATDCIGCHINRRPANHYDGQCSSCHTTSGWLPASFNHSFPTNHGGANGQCSQCHPSGGSSWTCFTCHNQGEIDKKHNEEGIPDYASRCLECHAGGDD